MLRIMMLRKKLANLQNEETTLRATQVTLTTRQGDLASQIEALPENASKEDMEKLSSAVSELESAQKTTKDRLEAIKAECDALLEEIANAEAAANAASGAGGDGSGEGENRSARHARSGADFERRCREFQRTGRTKYSARELTQNRAAVLSSSAGVAGPAGVNTEINDPLGNIVPSLIDMIPSPDCTGMTSYSVPYINTGATAGDGIEGNVPNESVPGFGIVEMKPALVNVVGYVSKYIRKFTPVQYEAAVKKALRGAVRQKMSDKVVSKLSESALLDGIELTGATGKELFDAKLLRRLIIAYGGNQAIVGAAVLNLNKLDLDAFAAVMGANEYLPAYKITPDVNNPNTGLIQDASGLSCRYSLNDALPALSTATLTTTAKPYMLYGSPNCAEMPTWGDVEVQVYEGAQIEKGLLTIVADVWMDADVTVPKGFVAIKAKKPA